MDETNLEPPIKVSHQRRFTEAELPPDCLDGNHHWYGTSHARPTYCNVCRETLGGVTSHGLSCEICKCKVHKRCSSKTINNCKWTTLASIGKDIIEDEEGNITMPHQWMEGNLPVSAKCAVCDKNCGSVLRLQDWRCLWCKAAVHTHCRPNLNPACPLGPARLSVVPPTALHSLEDETWEAIRPQASSPLLVFVNSKSGDNQGLKFLRRFKQLLNPAQVFDLMLTGPRPGLRLFRHFDPFRILVCSGDGSVGWVLSEIDKLDMHKQCQVGVLPLGTGNDLARVLGWGSSCDDDTHLPYLIEKYEKASTQMLDRWSIMTFERVTPMPKLSLTPSSHTDGQLHCQIEQYEATLIDHLQNILQSDDTSVILNSSKRLCEIVKAFAEQIVSSALSKTDEQLTKKCDVLQHKLELLLSTLTSEQINITAFDVTEGSSVKKSDDTDSEMSAMSLEKKCEKEFSNFNFRKHRRTSRFMQREKDALIHRANSLKKAIRNLIEHTEQAVDEQNRQNVTHLDVPIVKITLDVDGDTNTLQPSPSVESASSSNASSCPSPSGSILTARLINISPTYTVRKVSVGDDELDLLKSLPVPRDFADSRRSSEIDELRKVESISRKEPLQDIQDEVKDMKNTPPTLSSEDISICSEILDQKSLHPQRSIDSEDKHNLVSQNDSPETDTNPYSDPLHVDSIMEDMSSLLGEILHIGYDQESLNNTYTDDTFTLFHNENDNDYASKKSRGLKLVQALEKRRTSLKDEGVQFGFENHAFLPSQLQLLDKLTENKKYCSLAKFIDGNDIARQSFKRRQTSLKLMRNYLERKSTNEEVDRTHYTSTSSLSKLEKELSNKTIMTSKEERSSKSMFSEVNVVVEPPSPIPTRHIPSIQYQLMDSSSDLSLAEDDDFVKNDLRKNTVIHLNISPYGDSQDQLPLPYSPAATRRISSCSLLNQAESAALAAVASSINLHVPDGNERKDKKERKDSTMKEINKKLPIINPLVQSPGWPNVSTGPGFISKCLLANADTLCAAVGPLIDPDEMLSEGFYERCVMNNYFGIGIDAKISLDFHQKREEHPEKCRSRARNYMWYGVLGSKQLLQKTYKNLEQRVQLECDGQRIPLPSLQGIVILNIPSFMGGTNFWGSHKEDQVFLPQCFDDRIMEIVAVFGSVQMAASRLINLQHHRIAQCQSVQINILGEEGIPIQVDGEAWVQPPGIIRIVHKNRMQMLYRNRSLENSLKAWEEKQRHISNSISTDSSGKRRFSITPHDKGRYTLTRQSMPASTATERSFLGVQFEKMRQRSVSGYLTQSPAHQVPFAKRKISTTVTQETDLVFTDEEHYLMITFLEAATTLSRLIKILAISYTLEVDLYKIASRVDQCLENCHPNGKLLEGPKLRMQFSKLVAAFRQLYEDSCFVLHDRRTRLKLREDLESKLGISLANSEFELKKCVFCETVNGVSVVYLQSPSGEQDEHRRKGLSWLKFRSKSASPTPRKSRIREISAWGTEEVATWLETLQLPEYIETFIKNDIRGRELLSLVRRDLKDLQITKVGHVKRILQAINDLAQGF